MTPRAVANRAPQGPARSRGASALSAASRDPAGERGGKRRRPLAIESRRAPRDSLEATATFEVMDACRRVVAALLLVLWAAGGIQVPVGARGDGNAVARRTVAPDAAPRRHDGAAQSDPGSERKPSVAGDGLQTPPRAASIAVSAFLRTRVPAPPVADVRSVRGPVAGQPRGPPSLA
jgi:hypothetical protein